MVTLIIVGLMVKVYSRTETSKNMNEIDAKGEE